MYLMDCGALKLMTFFIFLEFIPTNCEYTKSPKLLRYTETEWKENFCFITEAKNICDLQRDHCVSKEAKNLDLLGSDGFIYADEKTVRTRLNGFRFNTNVEDITIFCRVLLKLPSSESGKINSNVCPQAVTGRRKRSLHSGDTTSLAVMQTLSVKDRGNQGLSYGTHTVAQVFTIAASLFMIRIL